MKHVILCCAGIMGTVIACTGCTTLTGTGVLASIPPAAPTSAPAGRPLIEVRWNGSEHSITGVTWLTRPDSTLKIAAVEEPCVVGMWIDGRIAFRVSCVNAFPLSEDRLSAVSFRPDWPLMTLPEVTRRLTKAFEEWKMPVGGAAAKDFALWSSMNPPAEAMAYRFATQLDIDAVTQVHVRIAAVEGAGWYVVLELARRLPPTK